MTDCADGSQVAWLTPSEIFTPHYGAAVASCLLEDTRLRGKQPLRVIEIGGGTGTLAKDVLDKLRQVILLGAPRQT